MQWICHCVRLQIDSVGVFVWALAPFLCFGLFSAVCFAVSAGETQVWLGDLRVAVFGVVVFFVCCFIDLLILRTFLSLYSVLSAYSHVRTEPLVRHRPHSRKKKERLHQCLLSCVTNGTGHPPVHLYALLTTQAKAVTRHVMESSAKRGGTFAQSRAVFKRMLCPTTRRSLDGVQKSGAGSMLTNAS